MSFGAKKIFPLDNRPGTAIGVSVPFNNDAVFFSTYTTQDAIRNNLINFFLIDQGELYLNPNFGANLRQYVFEQITTGEIDGIKEYIQSLINRYFINIKIDNIDIFESSDYNEIKIELKYSIINTGITDQVQISFT